MGIRSDAKAINNCPRIPRKPTAPQQKQPTGIPAGCQTVEKVSFLAKGGLLRGFLPLNINYADLQDMRLQIRSYQGLAR